MNGARPAVGVRDVEAALAAGASGDVLLDLVDDAIESAAEAADRAALERLASLLATAAAAHPRLAVAAERARATASLHADAPARAERPVPAAAEAAPALVFSGWWRRFGAHALDWLVILVLYTLLLEVDAPALSFVPLAVAYFAVAHTALGGRTPGKLACGIAVRRTDGSPVDLAPALGRALLQALLWLTLVGGVVDALWPLGESRRRALHDIAADTVVVRTR